MSSSANLTLLDARIRAIVDERLIAAFASAAVHFGTSDLVLCFDESVEEDPVTALPRDSWVEDASLSKSIREKLNKPAREAAARIGAGDVAFWLLFLGADGETGCVAVNAKLMGPSGRA